MLWAIIPLLVALHSNLSVVQGQQSQGSCKAPAVAKRLLADDVRFASPFYVIALPRNAETVNIDNVCYTYFENDGKPFNHIISVTYKDGSNKYHRFTKGDIPGSMGLAEAKAEDTSCIYHDYTLIPICNSTVFVLYRCFLEGSCNSVDIGRSQGVDARVALAATPTVSQDCYNELNMNLKDTSSLKGGDYIILPQANKPQCVTKYNDTLSIGFNRSAGSKEVVGADPNERFGGDNAKVDTKIPQKFPGQTPPKFPGQVPPRPAQTTWTSQGGPMKRPVPSKGSSYNPSVTAFQTSVSGPGHSSSFAFSQASSAGKPGAPTWHQQNQWSQGQNQWSQGPNPWSQQQEQARPGDGHYHTWHGPPAGAGAGGVNPNANNIYYHVHSWENPPPNCCSCN